MNIILTVGVLLIVCSFLFQIKRPLRKKGTPHSNLPSQHKKERKNKREKKGFLNHKWAYWGFLLVFLIMGFQEGVDGDFVSYKETFQNFHVTGDAQVGDAIEWGWVLVVSLFSLFPFWFFIMCLSAFQCSVLAVFSRINNVKEYKYLSAIIFYFTFSMMLMQMKALSQGLAVELMVLAFVVFQTHKKVLPSILCALFAFFVHNSALVLLPFLLLFIFISKNRHHFTLNIPYFPIIIGGLFVVLYIFKEVFLVDYFSASLFSLLEDSALQYSGYLDESNTAEGLVNLVGEGISPLIVAYDGAIVLALSLFYHKVDPRMRLFYLLAIVACFGDMLFFGMGSLSRIFMYFSVFNIAVYPSLVKQVKNKYGRVGALIILVLMIGYSVKTSIGWMMSPVDGRFGTYHFVFW